MFAEKRSKLVANYLNDLLVRRKLQHDFAAQRFTADVGKEFVHDAEGDVAFQHGLANFRQCGVQMLIRELALAAQVLECTLKFFCKVLKHGESTRPSSNSF